MVLLDTHSRRRALALSRLARNIRAVFGERHRAVHGKAYSMPLAALLETLGYTLTPAHPYGQKSTRNSVQEAIKMLNQEGDWHAEVRDGEGLEKPLGLPQGVAGDDLWVIFDAKALPQGYTEQEWTHKERYLAAELARAKKEIREYQRALGRHYRKKWREAPVITVEDAK